MKPAGALRFNAKGDKRVRYRQRFSEEEGLPAEKAEWRMGARPLSPGTVVIAPRGKGNACEVHDVHRDMRESLDSVRGKMRVYRESLDSVRGKCRWCFREMTRSW